MVFNLVALVQERAGGRRRERRAGSAGALYDKAPMLDLLQAIVLLQPDDSSRRGVVLAHLREPPGSSCRPGAAPARRRRGRAPSRRARHLVRAAGSAAGLDATEAGVVRDASRRGARPLQRYRCAACGFEAQHFFWHCPGCLSWDSYPPRAGGGAVKPLVENAGASRARVLVVGDVMLDRYWFGAVERISPEAPVPVVRVEPRRRSASAAPPTWRQRRRARRAPRC